MHKELVNAAREAAAKHKIPLANLLAVIEVESDGVSYATVNHKSLGKQLREPLIRWEGHYFDKRLGANSRAIARKQGLADPKAGGIKNPSSQEDRWNKLFWPAYDINEQAAIESASYGVGQVMGAHWDKLGYSSAQHLLDSVRSSLGAQVYLMVAYIVVFGLLDELQRGDFQGFARGYNGPNFRKYKYDTKMKAAAKKYAQYDANEDDTAAVSTFAGVPVLDAKKAAKAASMLRMGTEGAKVRELQSLLRRAGYAIDIDGDFGVATKRAVEGFQKAHDLDIDGIVGPQTWQALEAHKVDPTEMPGVPGPAEAVVATPEGRQGAVAAGAAMTLEGAKEVVDGLISQVADAAGTLSVVNYVMTALTVTSATLALAGIGWAIYGWYKANTTRGVRVVTEE